MNTELADRLSAAVAGRYRLGPLIGQGGMAVVFRADDLRHDRPVAIKVFTAAVALGGSERFEREIGFLARLNHPHILPLLDSGAADGLLYYVMPFVEGESLRERMSREPRPTVPESVRLLIEVCDALRYAHAQNIVHRDIKPENIMLVDRHAVVADFGVARAVRAGETGSSLTSAGLAVGTPAYMSPEQAAADPKVDHRTDLYALGVVAYELLHGQPPFAQDSPAGILASHVTTPPPDLGAVRPELPPALAAAVMRCLAKRPDDRWPDAGALRDALERFSVTSGALTPVPMPPYQKVRRRARIGAVAAGVMLTAVIALRVATRPPPPLVLIGEPQRLGLATELELDPAISPDGHMVAYASGTLGAMKIQVRHLAGGDPVIVAETVDGSQRWPRWAPDGATLTFQAGGTVWSVPALGGPARRLVDGTPGQPAGGFVWSPDGTRAAFVADGALRVRPAGTSTSTILVRDGAAHSPTWSPDGRWIAYVSGNAEFTFSEALLGNVAPSTLRVISADGGDPVTLTDGSTLATSPVWLDRETLVFVGGGAATRDLFAQRIGRGGRASGPPTRLSTGLRLHTVARVPTDSALVYVQLDQVSNVWAVPLPYPGEPPVSIRQGRAVTEGDQVVEDMDVFPVSGMLLFDSNRGGSQDIWLQTGPGTPVALTSDPAPEFGPVWSPNGREVAYYAVRDGVRHVFVMTVTGEQQVQVTADSLQDQQPQWSPDGNSLVFYRRDGMGRDRLFVTTRGPDSAWSEPRPLTDEYGTAAHWSSDGRWIAFTDAEGNLRVVDAEGGPSRVIARPEDVGGLPIRRPYWLHGEFTMLARVEGPGGTGGIWRFSIMGDPPEEMIRFDDPRLPVYRTDLSADRYDAYVVVSQFGSTFWRVGIGRLGGRGGGEQAPGGVGR